SPVARLRNDRQRLVAAARALRTCAGHAVALRREQVQARAAQLAVMNPYATLDRGYSITYRGGRVVSSVAQVQAGDGLEIQLSDGRLPATACAS
ncbi:MAG: exodeoxyribonuclease VII large subunit, partial [Chloroflexota bacterium]